MHKVTITVNTKPVEVPTGVTPGLLRFNILDESNVAVHTQDVTGTVAEFSGVEDGSYIISVVRVDANGVIIGKTVTQRFTVEVIPVPTFEEPSSISISVVQE